MSSGETFAPVVIAQLVADLLPFHKVYTVGIYATLVGGCLKENLICEDSRERIQKLYNLEMLKLPPVDDPSVLTADWPGLRALSASLVGRPLSPRQQIQIHKYTNTKIHKYTNTQLQTGQTGAAISGWSDTLTKAGAGKYD